MIISFISSKKSFSNQQEVIHRYVADSHALITKALNTNNKTFCQNQNGKITFIRHNYSWGFYINCRNFASALR